MIGNRGTEAMMGVQCQYFKHDTGELILRRSHFDDARFASKRRKPTRRPSRYDVTNNNTGETN